MHPFFALHHESNVYTNSYFKLFTFDLTRYFLSLFIVLIRLASQKVCGKTKIKKVQLDNNCGQTVHYLVVHFTLCSTPGFFFSFKPTTIKVNDDQKFFRLPSELIIARGGKGDLILEWSIIITVCPKNQRNSVFQIALQAIQLVSHH